jgi:hypothetical protein
LGILEKEGAMPTTLLELQTRFRELVAKEGLPPEPPRVVEPRVPGMPADPIMRVRPGWEGDCILCLDRGPDVSYVYRDGREIRVHAGCHGLWRALGKLAAT